MFSTAVKNLCRLTAIVALSALLTGCEGFCVLGKCFTSDYDVTERRYDPDEGSFTLSGNYGDEIISHTYDLYEEESLTDLSFGMEDGGLLRKNGIIRQIDVLNETALETYRTDYLATGENCPAPFMNKNLQRLVLIGATESINDQLESYDIPFDGRGTEFDITGHFMKHTEGFFVKDEIKRGLTPAQSMSIASNMGSARRQLHYFLVTEL